ncbi:MAG: hypothetical protein Q4B29_02400, partial [Candidatus Saccharibacteria bacterium]|nr:hypothetical protein [Candidatus Saccharibacteria bacterium]
MRRERLLRQVKLVAGILWVSFNIVNFFVGEMIFAASESSCLNDSLDETITSIRNACSKCFSEETPQGAMWMNSSKNNSKGDVVEVGDEKTTATFYLRGRVYTCVTAYSTSKELWANNVSLCSSAAGCNSSASLPDWIVEGSFTQNSKLFRGNGTGTQYTWTTTENTKYLTGKIDIAKFKEELQGTVDGEYTIYERTVWVYRCFYDNQGCGSDPSTIRLKVKNTTYYSESEVKIGDDSDETAIRKADGDITSADKVTIKKTIPVGSSLRINYSHQTYTSLPDEATYSKINNSIHDGLSTNENYTVSYSDDLEFEKNTKSDTELTGEYFKAHGYSHGYDVTFLKAGVYTLCERIDVGKTADSTKKSTKSCAEISVVYNFNNTAELAVDPIVYSGETITVESAAVNVTKNDTTIDGTSVVSPETRLVAYLSASNDTSNAQPAVGTKGSDLCSFMGSKVEGYCQVTDTSNKGLNQGDNSFSYNTLNVYDVKAGNYMCLALAVYPAKSNGVSMNGNDRWYISKPACSPIAKRPSFQVHGGSIFSNGLIKTSISTKNNLQGVDEYPYIVRATTKEEKKQLSFGSWVEQAIIANGTVTGLASGATLADGNGSLSQATLSTEKATKTFCKDFSPLSFANYASTFFSSAMCPTVDAVGNAGASSTGSNREALINYWLAGANVGNKKVNGAINLHDATKYTDLSNAEGIAVRYVQSDGDISLNGETINAGETYLVRANNVTLNGNIIYQNGAYNKMGQIPKLIIYATNNVNITCNATKIDAILIAGGMVNTCSDGGDVNSANRSKQLNILGMVIADALTLDRTYGAATGANSGIPAEIINYDTSTLLWGRYKSETT